jgi:CheY-like chemotaxis protein
MSVLWLIEDSPQQLKDLRSLLMKMGHSVYEFRDVDELLEGISKLPLPEAVIVDLALKGTSNGFQAAQKIRKLRPDIDLERFCFISGWKKQFNAIIPPEFRDSGIIDKANWTLDDLQKAIAAAVSYSGGV